MPIIVRQFPGERAIIDGNRSDGNVLTINGSYTWYVGFEVTNSYPAPNSGDGVTFGSSVGTKLIDLIVHDNAGNGIGAWSQSTDCEIYGCLSFFNGRLSQANHAYGIYGQNQTGQKLIQDNIFIHNFGNYPMHIFGTSEAYLDNFYFVGNVFCDGWALIGGGRIAQNPTFDSNFFYGDSPDSGIFDLGWQTQFGPGVNNAVLTGNYFLGGTVNFNAHNTGTTATANTFYGRLINFSPDDYPGNTYYVANSPQAPPRPPGEMVFVRPNKYETGRANIVAYNWNGDKAAAVDLSSVLQAGDSYEILDAQDYFGPPVKSGTYDGGTVRLPLSETETASPVSVPADRSVPRHTGSEFGIFVVLRTT